MKCDFCGEEFETKIDIEARFCCDAHRVDWHNERNRALRLEIRARKAIEDLIEIYQSESTNKLTVDNGLWSIKRILDRVV